MTLKANLYCFADVNSLSVVLPLTLCTLSLIYTVPALITTGGFGKARKKRAAADGNERAG